MLKEFFWPDKRKTLFGIILAAFFWFFPIVSKSVLAFPFFSLSSAELSAALNILAAYIFGCALAVTWGNKRQRTFVILAITLIYLAVPKVASYAVGDMAGVTENYCDCYGVQIPASSCCNSAVNYCVGVCQRNEKTEQWPPWAGT